MAWVPILESGDACRADQAIAAIAEALRVPPPPYDGRLEDEGLRVSLSGREPGFALFHAYLSRVRPDCGYEDLARAQLQVALDHVPLIVESRPYFAYGLAGCAWATEHLRGWIVDDSGEDPLEDIDLAVTALAEVVEEFDLRVGLVGYGVYALERTHAGCLDAVVRGLTARVEREARGVFWRTPQKALYPDDRARFPDGIVSLGVKDGLLGPIAVLAGAGARGAAPDHVAIQLADDAVAWLRTQRLADGGVPSIAGGGNVRPSWCAGEVGIAGALYAAGAVADRPAWQQLARDIAHVAVGRVDFDNTGFDASLGYGAAGVAHAFNRLYQATHDHTILAAARHWFQRTLEMFRPSRGLGGFLFHHPVEDTKYIPELPSGWVDCPGLWRGLAGDVGLALLAATSDVEPSWDRSLLLSFASRSVS